MVECIQCNKPFLSENCIASISGSIMGDECTDSYFLCPRCEIFTLVSWWDDFTGLETRRLSGPLSRQDVAERLELIGKCPSPWDKKCRCDAHLAYFNNALD